MDLGYLSRFALKAKLILILKMPTKSKRKTFYILYHRINYESDPFFFRKNVHSAELIRENLYRFFKVSAVYLYISTVTGKARISASLGIWPVRVITVVSSDRIV